MNCENCNKDHNGEYGSGRFCSQKCSRGFATRNKRVEINKKVSKSLSGKYFGKRTPRKHVICIECSDMFEVNINHNRKYCGFICKQKAMGRRGGMNSTQGKRSKNEILFYELCHATYNNVLHNEPIFNGWDADVILEDYKIAVMWNGKWHYEKITESHSVLQVQNRDKLKLKEIKKSGYVPYIIKDMGSYDPNFVKTEFEKFKKYIAGS